MATAVQRNAAKYTSRWIAVTCVNRGHGSPAIVLRAIAGTFPLVSRASRSRERSGWCRCGNFGAGRESPAAQRAMDA